MIIECPECKRAYQVTRDEGDGAVVCLSPLCPRGKRDRAELRRARGESITLRKGEQVWVVRR